MLSNNERGDLCPLHYYRIQSKNKKKNKEMQKAKEIAQKNA